MRSLKIVAAALLVGASGLAIAQEVRDPSAEDSFGADVSALAKAQHEGETRGIGSEVSVLAREQGELHRGAADGHDGPDEEVDGDEGDHGSDEGTEGEGDIDESRHGENGEAALSQGIGAEVSAMARAQRDSEDKGLGEHVRAMTPAATRPERPDHSERSAARANARVNAEAVAGARGSNREIRGGSGAVADLRGSVASTRSSVASSRADVAATRAQAGAARNDARGAAEHARQVRDHVRSARPGSGG